MACTIFLIQKPTAFFPLQEPANNQTTDPLQRRLFSNQYKPAAPYYAGLNDRRQAKPLIINTTSVMWTRMDEDPLGTHLETYLQSQQPD